MLLPCPGSFALPSTHVRVLQVRQYNLINMFDAGNLSKSERAAGADDSSLASSNRISREGSAVGEWCALMVRMTTLPSGCSLGSHGGAVHYAHGR